MYALPKRPVTESPLYSTTYIVKAQRATSNLRRRLSPMPRNALGRGLSALIREPEPAVAPVPAAPVGEAVQHIDIDLIDPSPYQPRTRFHESALEELARSIRTSGIIQPLLVRRLGNRYQ